MKWATRKSIRIDRQACCWLILRKIDPEAEIVFVNPDEISNLTSAGFITFDADGATYAHSLASDGSKYGELCSFQTMAAAQGLVPKDPALELLGRIVHAGDIGHRLGVYEPREGYGMWALAQGNHLSAGSDREALGRALPIWDAMYAYCNWQIEGGLRA